MSMLSRRASDGTVHRSDVRLFFGFGNDRRDGAAALRLQAERCGNRCGIEGARFHLAQCTGWVRPGAIVSLTVERRL